MRKLSGLVRAVIRFLIVWFVDTISLLVTAGLVAGIELQPVGGLPVFVVATVAAFVLGIVNLLVRPLLLMITLPLGWIAVFVAGFFINGVTLLITSGLMAGLEVSGLWAAFLGGLVLSLINTIVTTILAVDDEDSFYENLVQRQAARQAGNVDRGTGRGLVILETDGLSYQRIQKAIAEGWMPTLKQMIEEEGYRVSRVDCGVPPTTPACQAGILQGNNTNIPAFRWLDKKTGRVLAGGQAAAEVEPILSDGNGLLRGGSSIGNMFSGDAAKSILTFSKIFTGTPEDKKQRAQDMYLLMRNPYFFTRVLVLFFADVLLEIWQGWQQRRADVQPRLNRLHNGYPFLRAAVNVFLRDIGTYFTILDIVRGAPAMYTLYAGYDEIAHHSGPYTHDADITLTQFDKQVARIRRVIENKAPRPYEILLLSDHGQSFGATFKQRYGMSILEFIEAQLPQGTSVAGSGGGDDGTIGVAAMMDELHNMQENKQGGTVGKAAIRGAQRLIKSNLEKQESFQEVKPAKVTLAYGGNGALVYFDLFPRKITLTELNNAYPGMVDMLVQHEGIGFVIAYEDDYTPVAFGKKGARNLHTGDVVGEDPLKPYGDVALRSWQLERMANFDNSGDLILNSTIYPDGTVAALEELIGNHGGLGGEQTDAYIFHPGDMVIPETRGSFEFKAILDSRRGLPGETPKPERPSAPQVDPWAPSTLAKGLGQVGQWLRYAAGAIVLNREAYRQIAADAYMTAPALLISFVAQVLQSLNSQKSLDITNILVRYGVWFLAVLVLHLSVYFLRGREKFTATMRVAAFAQSAHVLELLGFLPLIGPLARFIALVVAFFGVWIGTATAHQLRGWRTLLLPVIYLLILVVGVVFLMSVLQGTAFAIDALLTNLGWTPAP
jgi:uncharacterized membrane protein YvlD (DUF360 family)